MYAWAHLIRVSFPVKGPNTMSWNGRGKPSTVRASSWVIADKLWRMRGWEFRLSTLANGWWCFCSLLSQEIQQRSSQWHNASWWQMYKKVKVSYLTLVAKQAKTAFLHGPMVWKAANHWDRTRNLSLPKRCNKRVHHGSPHNSCSVTAWGKIIL